MRAIYSGIKMLQEIDGNFLVEVRFPEGKWHLLWYRLFLNLRITTEG